MRIIYFIAAVMLLFCCSCRFSRGLNKTNSSVDSTNSKTSQNVTKSDKTIILESKSVTKSQGNVTTKADSAKGNFSFHPDRDSVIRAEVESGGVKATVAINTKTGKGSLSAYKKPESVPVDQYQEQSHKSTFNNTDSNYHKDSSNTDLKKDSSDKNVESSTSTTFLWLLVLLALALFFDYFGYGLFTSFLKPKNKS